MVKKVNRVITFYSYKGGVGRSMAMANIGVILSKWGFKTLLIDWDLEAPGLESYFANFLNIAEVTNKPGLIDLLNLKEKDISTSVEDIKWEEYLTHIAFEGTTNLDLINSGRRDENYFQNVRKFDFNTFYQESDGGQYLEDLRDFWLDNYEFILIDSRTGLTDSSGICSIHMPDILVLLFTPNEQSFNGIKSVAKKAIEGQKQVIFDRFRLRTLPIPSRIENAETLLLDEWMKKISAGSDEMFEWLPKKEENTSEFLIAPSLVINHIKIPYKTLYAFGERLAVIERGVIDPIDLGYVYETIAAIIANDLQNIHLLASSRDDLVKKAKGEDIVDHFELQRKIAFAHEEKGKLEEQLLIKDENVKVLQHTYRKNRSRIISLSFLFVIIAGIAIYFLTVKNRLSADTSVRDTSVRDTSAVNAALNSSVAFVADYTTSHQQYDLSFNLKMISRFYQLDKNYQDSLRSIKQQIENTIEYKFHDLIDSFYYSVREKPDSIANYLADKVEDFGQWKNLSGLDIQNKLGPLLKQTKITNKSIDSTIVFESDSSGFKITFTEIGNVLLDQLKEFKRIKNSSTAIFDTDLKIKSLTYISQEEEDKNFKVELFFCNSSDNKGSSKQSIIFNSLKATNEFDIRTKNNFTTSSDPSSPYYVTSNQIRYNGRVEYKVARSIQKIIQDASGISLELVTARTPTRNYISVFLCADYTPK